MDLSSLVRRWMHMNGHASSRGQRTDTPPARHRTRLQLETLEDRSVPSTVTNLFDSGAGSLRRAILDTPSGGTVDFQPGLTGTINLTSGELAISRNLTITGPGAGAITVSGNNASRVFDIAATFTVSISGLTIANGKVVGDDGGGIFNAGTLAVSNCVVSNSSALSDPTFGSGGNGGGIFSIGMLTVSNSTIRFNSAQNNLLFGFGFGSSGNGGGISSRGTLSISNSTISNNSAVNANSRSFNSGNGGGITSNGTLTLSNSKILDNSLLGAFGEGSAIFSGGGLSLSGSTISGNRGGIIAVLYNTRTTATISNCSLTGNPSGQACIEGNGTLTVNNSNITGNGGYGVWNGSGTATISNSTIAGNNGYGFRNNQTLNVSNSTIAGNSLGGLENIAFSSNATALLVSTTVAGNGGHQLFTQSGRGTPVATATVQLRNTIVSSAGSNANLFIGPAGRFISLGHNLSSDGGSGYLNAPGDLRNTDPRLGPLQDNGGPTLTMALLPGSPALNAGDPTQLGVADQRGVVRSGGVNIGAYQASASAFVFTFSSEPVKHDAWVVTVTAYDVFGNVAIGYTGTVTFSSSDNKAILPDDYTFTAEDAGTHTFSVFFHRLGQQTFTVTDTVDASIFGSVDVLVHNPGQGGH